jgi:sulfur carrier protein ThiS
MSVCIRLGSLLRKYVQDYNHDSGIVMENVVGWNVKAIIDMLQIPAPEVTTVILNSYPGAHKSMIKDGDSITLTKVVGGG